MIILSFHNTRLCRKLPRRPESEPFFRLANDGLTALIASTTLVQPHRRWWAMDHYGKSRLRAPTQYDSTFERLIFFSRLIRCWRSHWRIKAAAVVPLDGVGLHRPSSDGLLRLPCQRHETLALGATIILRRGSYFCGQINAVTFSNSTLTLMLNRQSETMERQVISCRFLRTETLEPEQVVDVGQRASRGTGRFMWQTLDHGRVIR